MLLAWLCANPSVTFVQLGKRLSCRRKVGIIWHLVHCEILCGRCQNSVWKSLAPYDCPSTGQFEVLWDCGVVWSGCKGCSVLHGLMI